MPKLPRNRWTTFALLPIGLALLLVAPPGAAAPATPAGPSHPSPRWVAPMAYDAKDRELVLFGGGSGTLPSFADTWTYRGGVWQNITARSGSPPGRAADSIAYDPVDGYVVMFGGNWGNASGSGLLNDTWTFAGGTWTRVSTSVAPSPRFAAGMTWDAKDGYLLLFGGDGPSTHLNDSWKFLHGRWTLLSANAPPPARRSMGLTYDPKDGYVVLFGGLGNVGDLSDTWSYAGGTWTQLSPSTTPSTRLAVGMTYDPSAGKVILYGGRDDNLGAVLGDTWAFVGGAWAQIHPPTNPSHREWPSFAFDGYDRTLVMFGGGTYIAPTPIGTGVTVVYTHGTWS